MRRIAKPAFAAALLAACAGGAVAQSNFQLPRECSERHNVDPDKCVINDGPPPPPWVHPIPLNAKPKSPTATTPPPAAPVTGQMPARPAR